MHVLLINQYFPPDASNSAYMLGELAEDLALHHRVDVVAGRPSYSASATDFRPVGVRVTRVRSTAFNRARIAGRLLNYATYLGASMVRVLRVERPDLIVVMTDPPMAGAIGLVASWRHRRPLVQISHDVYPEIAVALGRLRSRLAIALWRSLNRRVRHVAAGIIVVGRDMGERLARDGVDPGKIEVIPTWATSMDVSAETRRVTRARNDWEGRFVVMHAGNAGIAQDLDALLDAATALRPDGDIDIVVLGDGAAKDGLMERVRTEGLANVTFLAHRPKADAQALMQAADLHVVSLVPGLWGCAAPSKTYGIMAAGRPFVAAVDPGAEPARVAIEFNCGAFTPAGDGLALADTIRRMKEWSLDEYGQRALEAFQQHYTRDRVTLRTRLHLERIFEQTR